VIVSSIILILTAIGAGLFAISFPTDNGKIFRYSLIFSGAYLFSITVIHILPDLFRFDGFDPWLGVFVLAGFFLQRILEIFTSGVEHGHLHNKSSHSHSHPSAIMLVLALCLHAFLEGALLAGESDVHPEMGSTQILFGIAIHKMPAAFALMSVLLCQFEAKRIPIIVLLIFSMATPVGLILSSQMQSQGLVSSGLLQILFAVVAGNFLYISTTIFYESSPSHGFQAGKLVISLLGAGLAVILELTLGKL
jgi:zinc and cadmium transporter